MTYPIDIVVYVATNLVDGGEYVGVASHGVAKRRREHFCASRKGSMLYFHRAIQKHGQNNFRFVVLEKHDDYSVALKREMEIISERKPKYNLTLGGEGALGFKMPAEIVKRLAESRRGTVGYWRGKKRPEAATWLLRNGPTRYWKGKKRSAETNEKISKTKTGVPRKPPPEHALEVFRNNMRRAAVARRRKVICLDDGLTFDSSVEAAKHYGFKSSSVNQVCDPRRPQKSLFGKSFKYLDQLP
jgi:group I intron endonuclease